MPGLTEPHAGRTDPADRPDARIRVAVVDDHPIARQGLARILEGAGNIDLVASCADPNELGPEPPIDVLLLDLYLNAHMMALDVITKISARVPVLVISA
ncbi:response regulator transcription factor [Kibdelosporangium persicum]|uniref:Response regulatory domain-containing protein n=1 Tax=Kibdelosporangium persicum TaxID=2698649 RepID=A0ABX2FBG9_9PSEU|nr:response regulator [Kibdelosporangium persicum]NRN68723.1 hypothetical protein [Kibdelosporangium persicum]